jgi:CheY-like chemotaxis protein
MGDLPRVLIAEDNEVNQAVATITLRKRGFEVESAASRPGWTTLLCLDDLDRVLAELPDRVPEPR